MRCPSCNRFAAYDTGNEPEADLQFENESFAGTVRIVLTSECCGDELKEFTFDVDASVTLEDILNGIETVAKMQDVQLPDDFRGWTIDQENSQIVASGDVEFSGQITSRTETAKLVKGKLKPIPPRYQKSYYGFEGTVETTVTAKWQVLKDTDKTLEIKTLNVKIEESIEDEVQASAMEEMV